MDTQNIKSGNEQTDEERQVVKLAMLDTSKEDIFLEGLFTGENQYGKYIGLNIPGNRIIFVGEGTVAFNNIVNYFNLQFKDGAPYPGIEDIKKLKMIVSHKISVKTLRHYNAVKFVEVR